MADLFDSLSSNFNERMYGVRKVVSKPVGHTQPQVLFSLLLSFEFHPFTKFGYK